MLSYGGHKWPTETVASMIPVMKLNTKVYDPRVLHMFDIINDAVQGNCKHSSSQYW